MMLLEWLRRRKTKKSGMGRVRTIAILNQSKRSEVAIGDLWEIANACYRQLTEHYSPFWESGAPDSIVVCSTLASVPKGAAVVSIIDAPDEPDALGYHYMLDNGQPIARVFVNPILDNGGSVKSGANSLSQTISHEVLEMVGDPYCNWWADMDGATEDSIELCDRVEGDTYEIDGVSVSNFLGPRAFRMGDGPYDWLGLLKSPFALTPGGYAIRREGGPAGNVSQVYGESYPGWKKELKGKKARFLRRSKLDGKVVNPAG